MSTMTTNTNNSTNDVTAASAYEDDDVERYDADPYHKKYGDKWKQYATVVRDVPQEDGSVIREYVIEDPSIFDELSEQEEENHQNRGSYIRTSQSVTNNNNNNNYIKQSPTVAKIVKSESAQLPKSPPVNTKLTPSSSLQQYNKMSNLPSTVNIIKSSKSTQLQDFKNLTPQKTQQGNERDNIRKLSTDSADKEMEAIQEEHKKQANPHPSISSNKNSEETTIVEYEIIDEYGNLIKLDDAEHLKQLATCVKHVQESDGSITKEYILNDPKVIENIKNRIREKSQQQQPQSKIIPTSSSSSSSSASISQQSKYHEAPPPPQTTTTTTAINTQRNQQMPINSNNKTPVNLQSYKLPTHLQMVRLSKINGGSNEAIEQQAKKLAASARTVDDFRRKQQTQHQQQQNGPTKSDTELRQIDFNKYEIVTSSGKTIQFTITNGNASSSDVKEIKNAIENRILTQPQQPQQQQPMYLPLSQYTQSAKQQTNLKINKSCDNLLGLNDEDSQSAFINYKNTNNGSSQASLAKLKEYGCVPNNAFRRSMSLSNLDDVSNDPIIDHKPHVEPPKQQQLPQQQKQSPQNVVPINNDASITPEMTEHLILKLLLQQLVSSDQNQDIQHNPQIQALQMQRQRLQQQQQQHQQQVPSAAANRRIYDQMITDKLPQQSTQSFHHQQPLNQYQNHNHHQLNDPYYRPYYPTNNNNNYSLLINRPLNGNDPYAAAAAYRYNIINNNNIYRK